MRRLVVAVVALAACRFDPARPLTWSYSATLNVSVPANVEREYAFFQLPQAFEFPAPRLARAQGRVMAPAAQGDAMPTMFHWQMLQFAASGGSTLPKGSYDWVIPLSKRCNARYCVGKFRAKETDFPAFDFAEGDFASLSVKPVGGSFQPGWQIAARVRYDF